MTNEVKEFVRSLCLSGRCLDVGSFDVNGCVRDLFPDLYIGLDMRNGPNVDVVAISTQIPFEDEFFDVVVCLEMLEHDPYPFETILEMKRVLKPGGTLVITVPGIGFPKHDYPNDYWRMTGEAVKVLLCGMEYITVRETSTHSFGCAKKPTSAH
jgi:SAM-dependent methyltransferase